MNLKTTISISEARSKIFDIAEEAQKPNNYYTLTENGRPKVVLISAREFESWQETLEVIRDFPALEKDIKSFKRDLKSGAVKNYASLDLVLASLGYVKESGIKYDLSGKNKSKSKKRTSKNSK